VVWQTDLQPTVSAFPVRGRKTVLLELPTQTSIASEIADEGQSNERRVLPTMRRTGLRIAKN